MSSTTYSFRVDSELKSKAESIYGALGQNLSSAINAFLKQSVRVGGYPFDMKLTGEEREMVLAMEEARDMLAHPDNYNFRSAKEVLAELKQ